VLSGRRSHNQLAKVGHLGDAQVVEVELLHELQPPALCREEARLRCEPASQLLRAPSRLPEFLQHARQRATDATAGRPERDTACGR